MVLGEGGGYLLWDVILSPRGSLDGKKGNEKIYIHHEILDRVSKNTTRVEAAGVVVARESAR